MGILTSITSVIVVLMCLCLSSHLYDMSLFNVSLPSENSSCGVLWRFCCWCCTPSEDGVLGISGAGALLIKYSIFGVISLFSICLICRSATCVVVDAGDRLSFLLAIKYTKLFAIFLKCLSIAACGANIILGISLPYL